MDVKHWFLSGTCFFCQNKSRRPCCNQCQKDFISTSNRCPRCSRETKQPSVCAHCIQDPPIQRFTHVLFDYKYPANHLIKAFKFQQHPELARYFAATISKNLIKTGKLPGLLLPVPLHKKRQRERGYNQSLEFAKQLAQILKLECRPSLCQRIRQTEPQSTLPMKDRKKNVKGAFKLTGRPAEKHVAIVDDVITSGTTITEVAKLLLEAGCERIDVWAIARA